MLQERYYRMSALVEQDVSRSLQVFTPGTALLAAALTLLVNMDLLVLYFFPFHLIFHSTISSFQFVSSSSLTNITAAYAETLQLETSSFGIEVVSFDIGHFRTQIMNPERAQFRFCGIEDYEGLKGELVGMGRGVGSCSPFLFLVFSLVGGWFLVCV
jgi:hypothetical protein